VLYNFAGTGGDGKRPYAGVCARRAGNLYGTTKRAVSPTTDRVQGDTTGKETVLHSFPVTVGDGLQPMTGLVLDAKGNLYGTTHSGGRGIDGGNGVVFKLDKAGRERGAVPLPPDRGQRHTPNGVVAKTRKATSMHYGLPGRIRLGTVFKRARPGS